MRLDDWPLRYNAVVAAAFELPFAWGEHDCITFAASVADALTGEDYLARVRAKYQWDSALSAARIIEAAGGLEALISEFLGSAIAWGLCTRGDVVLARNRDGAEIVTVLDGHYLLVPEREQHLAGLPLDAALKGWRL